LHNGNISFQSEITPPFPKLLQQLSLYPSNQLHLCCSHLKWVTAPLPLVQSFSVNMFILLPLLVAAGTDSHE